MSSSLSKRSLSTEREFHQRKRNAAEPTFANICTVDVLGATKGQRIRGVTIQDEVAGFVKAEARFYGWVEGVVLEIVSGGVQPMRESRQRTIERYGMDGWIERLARAWKLSNTRAAQTIQTMENSVSEGEEGYLGISGGLVSLEKGTPHVVGGEEVKFRIVEPGVWGQYEDINRFVETEQVLSPKDLYQVLNHGKKHSGGAVCMPGPYALQRSLFVQAANSGLVVHMEGDHVDIQVCGVLAPSQPVVSYDVSVEIDTEGKQKNLRIQLPPSRTSPFTIEHARTLVVEAMGCLSDHACELERGRAEIEAVFETLSHSSIGAGALKSLLQKALRYRAKRTQLAFSERLVDTRIVILVCVALLYVIKSSFVPDLGLQVRGCTNAAKRIGVIMVEDAWPPMELLSGLTNVGSQQHDPGMVLAALMGVALVTARVSTYEPPESIILASMLVAVACHQSDTIIDWRSEQPSSVDVHVTCVNQTAMKMAARVLRIVRSFGGDMNMFDTVAELTSSNERVRVLTTNDLPKGVMPIRHMIDQHVWRGMGFATAKGGSTFRRRHQLMFEQCTGCNPRLNAGAMLDETCATVRTIRNQQEMIQTLLFTSPPALKRVDAWHWLELPIDRGVLAAGVGPIAVKVTTTGAENVEDGYPREANMTWNLQVILGVDDREPIVMHTIHVRDNDKKPNITNTAKRKAISMARDAKYHQFSSPVLPDFNRVSFVDGEWRLYKDALASNALVWNYDIVLQMQVPYVQLPSLSNEMLDGYEHEHMLLVLKACLDSNTTVPGLVEQHESSIRRILDGLASAAKAQRLKSRTLQLRLLAMIRGKHSEVALPTPDRDGGLGADQLLAMDGDWLVYLSLLKIALVAPGALRPKMVPKFSVVDSRLLRNVEMIVAAHIASDPLPEWKRKFEDAYAQLERKFGTDEIQGREPFDYQLALVRKMLDRDQNAVVKPRGHFVSLDTGLGKTITAAMYILKYGAIYGNASTVIWFTPQKVLGTVVTELSKTWGLGEHVGVISTTAPELDRLINLVPIDSLSKGTTRQHLERVLVAAAECALIVVDEVHTLYNVAIKTSTVRLLVEACPRFVCMTATPTPGFGQLIGERWISDCVGFPLTKKNFIVGAAQTVAAKVELDIEAVEKILPVRLNEQVLGAHTQFLRDGGQWACAAETVRKATFEAMALQILQVADEDRAHYSDGGVLVFMDNEAEMQAMIGLLASKLESKNYTVGSRIGNETNANVGVAVTTKKDTAGYNFVRMGAIVTGVYAENAASRHQLRGRIRRIGQARKKVFYWTVYPKNTLLSILFERHNSVDSKNATLEQLAKEFIKRSSTRVAMSR